MKAKNKQQNSPFSVSRGLFYLALFLLGLAVGRHFELVKQKVDQKVVSKISKQDLHSFDFSLYWRIYDELERRYVDPKKLDAKKMYYGSIKGMVASLGDPATVFLDPEETKEFNKSLSAEYEGVGILLDMVKNTPHVVTVFEGSPAEEAGLKSGDFIIEVDGKEVIGKALGNVASMIRGPAGTKVQLGVIRKGKKLKITVTRGHISAPSMRFVENIDNVDIVRISRFTESSLMAWKTKWDALVSRLSADVKSGKAKGIVIDLRDNPGGYFNAAIYLLGDLLPKGSVVAYQADRSGIVKKFVTYSSPRLPGSVPVVVLVNEGTASAAEIVSGALQHYKRAYIIGTKTYGKGTVQEIVDFKGYDGSSLHITIYKWLLPNKKWITHEEPIVPDKQVEFDEKLWDESQVDSQIKAAIEYLKGQF